MRKADAVCTAYRDATRTVKRPRTYGQVVAFVRATLPLYEAALRKLEALEAPSRDEQAVRAWLAADRRVAKALRELGDAAERRDYPSLNAAYTRTEVASGRARRAAAALGLQACGKRFSGR